MALAILVGLLGLAPPTPEEGRATRAELRPGFVVLSPVGLAVPRLGRTPDTRVARESLLPSYQWGFAMGVHLRVPVPKLLLGLSASFDQVVWSVRDYRPGDELGSAWEADSEPICFAGDCYGWNERVVGSLLRVGVDLRIGWVDRRWLVWARASPHIGISRLRLDCDDARADACDRRHMDVGPGLGGGLGVAYRVVEAVALGVEADVDHEWLARFDDPFEAVRTWEIGLVALFSF